MKKLRRFSVPAMVLGAIIIVISFFQYDGLEKWRTENTFDTGYTTEEYVTRSGQIAGVAFTGMGVFAVGLGIVLLTMPLQPSTYYPPPEEIQLTGKNRYGRTVTRWVRIE